ncbi:MAG: NAD+ synthase [Thermoplasmata archaeon]
MIELVPAIAPPEAERIGRFLLREVDAAHATGVVVGLSGGIDSALTARLARDALGPDRVLGLLLPDRGYPTALREETIGYARDLGIRSEVIEIAPIEDQVAAAVGPALDRIDLGNIKARIRMLLLYARARPLGRLVAGTSNRSELRLGYFTKYGDGGSDLLPLGHLYKTQVRGLARLLELPAPILERAPTAGLWAGQTDEAELGLPYAVLDPILVGLDRRLPVEEIAHRTGRPPDEVRSVAARVQHHRHKSLLPPTPA